MTEEAPPHITPPGTVTAGDIPGNPSLQEQADAAEAQLSGEEKYAGKSVEEIIAMHKAAEAKITELSQPAPEQTPETQPAPAPAEGEFAGDALFQAAGDYYLQHGELTEEMYQQVQEQFGVSREVADDVIAGQVAKAQLAAQEIYSITGGNEQGYRDMVIWAERHLPPGEFQAFQDTVNSNQVDPIKAAAAGLWARFQQSGGGPPQLTHGRQAQSFGPEPFESWQQITEAMGDPRYGKDPAYTKAVEERVRVSQV